MGACHVRGVTKLNEGIGSLVVPANPTTNLKRHKARTVPPHLTGMVGILTHLFLKLKHSSLTQRSRILIFSITLPGTDPVLMHLNPRCDERDEFK
jgi:hypothetical protein